MIYKLWTTYPNHPLIVQKVILNMFYIAPNFLEKKPMKPIQIPSCILNQIKTWTTTRHELEQWSVQGVFEPLRKKSHQA